MISPSKVKEVVKGYDLGDVRIGTIGSHSALDIMDGAKEEGFKTVVVCQRGRETPYRMFRRLVDELIVLERFSDVIRPEAQARLRELNTVFVPHRAFTTYISYDSIDGSFLVPIFGNRALLRAEERTAPRNQYYLLEKAGIPSPKRFRRPEEIDRPVMVKVPDARRRTERAFFIATSYEDFRSKVKQRVEKGLVSEGDLKEAFIEELLVGTYFNFNYFYSPLKGELEFLGIDRRLQTNINDYVSLPAKQQLDMDLDLQNIEVGHMPATIRESMLEKVFGIGLRFVETVKQEYPPGIIGPFALQSAVTVDLDIVVYDVSPRMPGSPVLATTSPYTKYYFGEVVSTGRRVAMEIRGALKDGRLEEVVT